MSHVIVRNWNEKINTTDIKGIKHWLQNISWNDRLDPKLPALLVWGFSVTVNSGLCSASQSSTVYFGLFLNIPSTNSDGPKSMSFPSGEEESKSEAAQLSSTGCAAKSCSKLVSITDNALPGLDLSGSSFLLILFPISLFREHPMLELKGVGESLKRGAF